MAYSMDDDALMNASESLWHSNQASGIGKTLSRHKTEQLSKPVEVIAELRNSHEEAQERGILPNRLNCNSRDWSETEKIVQEGDKPRNTPNTWKASREEVCCAGVECREAYGVRGACSRFWTATG
jgi:hypothetical protein